MSGTLTELMEQAAAAEAPPTIIQGADGGRILLPDLLDSSMRVASDLRNRGVRNGDRVGLIVENGAGFFRVLFAVMYAGGVPVPLALPSAMGRDNFMKHVRRVTVDAQLRCIIVSSRVLRLLRRYRNSDGLLDCIFTDFIDEDTLSDSGPRLTCPAALGSLAYIQYTSGSTSSPKGVMLSHHNIAAGLNAIIAGSAVTAADVIGLWLPLFHDMGIFGALSCLAAGASVVLWRPADFVRRPHEWLGEFAARGCTLCAAPNFFFDHLSEAVHRVPRDLDLSRWRVAYNGAEPVLVNTIERFFTSFNEYGFRREAMFPVYGLAEATLAVTFPRLATCPRALWVDRNLLTSARRAAAARPGAQGALPLVAVGTAVPGVRVRISGTNGSDELVGEIEITGIPVTGGYYGPKNGELFTGDGWLRTGDLGFFHSGQLYVVGRSKDMIAIRGANYFAEDAEAIVRDLPGIYRRSCAAIATTTSAGASLTVVAETSKDEDGARQALSGVIRSEISASLGLADVTVHLVRPQTLPRTSSGKIRRALVRAQFSAEYQ